MAIINFSSHARAIERRNALAHHVVRSLVDREIPTDEDGLPVTKPLPVSVKVLTAFFVILGILIIGIITWRVVVWRRRRAPTTASQIYRQGSYSPSEKIRPIGEGMPMEKQEVLVVLPIEPPPSVKPTSTKWKPVTFPNANANTDNVVDVKSPPAGESAVLSPPPTYTVSVPSPASTPSSSPRPPALNLPALHITHDNNNLTLPAMPSPVPSPRRTSSFGVDALSNRASLKAKPSIKAQLKGQKLPRKMLVEHTFVPSLADELSIKVGETLCMLEEYEDEWCLVERIGSQAGERGVVPRFCLKERPRGHKRGQSSASAASSVRSGATANSRTQ